jgi:hypothetical protein
MRNVDASHEHIRETEAEDDAKRRKVQAGGEFETLLMPASVRCMQKEEDQV